MGRAGVTGTVGALVGVLLSLPPGAPATGAEPTCAGQPATVVGTDGADSLVGTDGPDVVSLGAGGDEFWGLGGDDVICGGAGGDELSGGEGANRVYGEAGPDELYEAGADLVVAGGPGDDVVHSAQSQAPGWTGTLDGGSGVDALLFGGSATGGLVVDVPAGTIQGAGSYDIARFEGYSLTLERDVFRGGPGTDRVYGTHGGDLVSTAAGADLVLIGSGPPSDSIVRTGSGDDRVVVSAGGRHRVWLGAGDDRALLAARVELRAGPGDDHVAVAGAGGRTWSVWGESGEDLLDLSGLQRAVRLEARAGTARLSNGNVDRFSGFERYRGTRLRDTLLGSSGPDRMHGGAAGDVIRGRGGNDVLIGDGGRDVIRGQSGSDVCSRGDTRGCERIR